MASVIPVRVLQDLKVKVQEQILVFPSQQTEKKSSKIFLSNIDQIFNYNVSTVHFFAASPEFPPEIVVKRLKDALEKVLVPYDFMAGKLQSNQHSGRLEIDCSGPGQAGFVVASSEYSIDELGESVYPNFGTHQLAAQILDNLGPGDDQPICIFQVTSFKCGGFAIGLTNNHVLLDGAAAETFMANLATEAFYDDVKQQQQPVPSDWNLCHNRRLLAARSPPHVDFKHPEFFNPSVVPGPVPLPMVSDCGGNEQVDSKIFKLTPTAVDYLKQKALENKYIIHDKLTTAATPSKNATRSNVAAALIWRCKALSKRNYQLGSVSTLLSTVDIRPRVNPALPPSYCGNAVLVAHAAAKYEDIEEMPFSDVVEMVAQGVERMSDEYVKSMIDWLEINKGPPPPRGGEDHTYTVVTTWLRMRAHQIVYPWGKPFYSTHVLGRCTDICWVFSDQTTHGGINALVSLPVEEMKRFEAYFLDFFNSPQKTFVNVSVIH